MKILSGSSFLEEEIMPHNKKTANKLLHFLLLLLFVFLDDYVAAAESFIASCYNGAVFESDGCFAIAIINNLHFHIIICINICLADVLWLFIARLGDIPVICTFHFLLNFVCFFA